LIFSESDIFDPCSTLTSYIDNQNCGCRGDDPQADLTQCGNNGYHVVEDQPLQNYKVLAVINGCEYYSYRVYACNGGIVISSNFLEKNRD